MHFIHTISLASVALAAALPAAAVTLEVAPGTLAAQVTDELKQATSLTLTGSMDKRDFDVLTDSLPALQELDLADVSVAEYKPYRLQGSMQAQYAADALPAGALLGKGLTRLVLPSTLKSIEQAALAGNLFESVEIPAAVVSIGSEAFYDCRNLKHITLPATVNEMGENVFAQCEALESANVGVARLPRGSFARCSSLRELVLASGLQRIDGEAFVGCTELTAVEFPASLRTIGAKAFASTGLRTVAVPASVAAVGEYAFALCPELQSASVGQPGALTEGMFFADPKLTSVVLPQGEALEYPDYLFALSPGADLGESLRGVSSIGRYALKNNAATRLELGAELEYLGDGAMEQMTGLREIDVQALGSQVPALGEDVFAGIEQSNVALVTTSDSGDAWRQAAQWQEFNVSPVASVVIPGVEAPEVRAWFAGARLMVKASDSIEQLSVCDPAGKVLLSVSPGQPEAEVDMSGYDARVYVVRVATPGATSTFKLTR